MRVRHLAATVVAALAVPATAAHAAWRPPQPVSPASADVAMLGVAAPGDRPAVLLDRRVRGGRHLLQLRRTARAGAALGAPVTVARARSAFEGAGLAAGTGGDLVAAWLEIVNGSRRPVVATGPRLADRQVLAPGPRSTQILHFAADRRGDAMVTFWRYRATGYEVFAAYRPAGGRFGPAQSLATGTPGWPVAAIADDGSAAVAWAGAGGMLVAERPAGATAFGPPAAVPGSGDADLQPGLAVGAGGALVTWTAPGATRTDRRVLVAQRAPGATTWSAPEQVSRPGAGLPRSGTPSALLDGGQAAVAWIEGDARATSRDHVNVAVRSADGSWPPARVARARGTRAVDVALLGPAPGRLPQVLVTTAAADFRRGLSTTTLREGGSLGPVRPVALGRGAELGRAPLAAQGSRRTWLGLDLWHRSLRRHQALLVSSDA
jgi:hypothetical protein